MSVQSELLSDVAWSTLGSSASDYMVKVYIESVYMQRNEGVAVPAEKGLTRWLP